MSRVIPQADDRLIQAMVVAQTHRETVSRYKAAAFESGQCNPARGEDAQDGLIV